MSVRRKALVIIMFRYVTDFPRHPQVPHQKLFWRTTLMSVRRRASVAIMFRYVSMFLAIRNFCTNLLLTLKLLHSWFY